MRPPRLPRSAALVGLGLVLAVGALAGCASSGGAASAGGVGSAPTSPTSPAGVMPTRSPTGAPSGVLTPPAVGVTVTVSGTVVEGAEPSCLILRTTAGQFELLSKTDGVHAGDHVTATGHVAQVMSHCMQGKPFQVDKLTIG
jgi:hypothetical protein